MRQEIRSRKGINIQKRSFFCSKSTIRVYCARRYDKIMKRALLIWAAFTALAVAQGNVSSQFENEPQQQSQNPAQPPPPQPAPPQPAQPQPAQGAPANSGAQAGSPAGGSNFLGKDVPFFDPGSNIVTWDGKSWNISNNALFQARFEKYLNAPPAISPPETEYQALLQQIMEKLSPAKSRPDPPTKLSSFWRKLRSIRMMPTSATPLPTRFTPLGLRARTTTG